MFLSFVMSSSCQPETRPRSGTSIDEIERLGDANKARAALANVNDDDDRSKPFVYDARNGNFVRNMGTLSLIPADRRVDVGAMPNNRTWIPYDVRTIRGILGSGRTPTIPHVPTAIIPENVRRLAQPNRREAQPNRREAQPNRREAQPNRRDSEIGHSIGRRAPNTRRERRDAMRREIRRIVGNASS